MLVRLRKGGREKSEEKQARRQAGREGGQARGQEGRHSGEVGKERMGEDTGNGCGLVARALPARQRPRLRTTEAD